jgi:hypothetical protein
MSTVQATGQILRRLAGGAAGTPAGGLLPGQFFHNEQENVLYIGLGNDGANKATSILKIGGIGAFADLASAQTIAGKKTFSISPVVPNGLNPTDAAAFGQIAAALLSYAPLAGGTFTGGINVPTPAPNDSSSIVPNTGWVQALLSALMQGWQTKPTANGATTAALPAYTYANGTSGNGATITGTAIGALGALDTGYTPAAGDLLLVKNEAGSAQAYNGLYVVTAAGSGATPYRLTRHPDMDAASEFSGALIPIGPAGQGNANSIWLCNPAGSVTVGTTAILFTELNAATQLLAALGGGLQIIGNQISMLGYSTVPVGSLLKVTAGGLAQAMPGTDYTPVFTGIDAGTA